MAQTTIQNSNSIRTGSAKLEIGSSLSGLVDIGAIRGLNWKQKGQTDEIAFDNTKKISKTSDGDRFIAAFKLCEINWGNIKEMNDGQVAVSNVSGTPVVAGTQTVNSGTWAQNQGIILSGQNSSGAIPTNITVVGSVSGAVAGANYDVLKIGDKWALFITGSVSTSQNLVITSDYTPLASKVITFNATAKKLDKYFRITNTDSTGKKLIITMQGTTNTAPVEISFASDNEANISEMPIELDGYVLDIVDEQA